MRRLLGRLALLVVSPVVALGAAELTARLTSPQPAEDLLAEAPESAPPELYAPDPSVLMHPVSHYSGYSGRGVYVRTDSLGCRGTDREAGEGAWLMVGDSFTMAVQVPEQDTFSALLEGELGVPVYNCGADGWTTFQAALRYAQVSRERPLAGVVYVLFTGNDLMEDQLFLSLARLSREADGTPRLPPAPRAAPPGGEHPAPGLFERLRRNSVLWSAVEVSRRRYRAARGDYPEAARFREEFGLFTSVEPQRYDPAWRALRAALMALRATVAAGGDHLLVAVAPPVYAVEPERATATAQVLGVDPATLRVAEPQARTLALLAELGIDACDLAAPLSGAGEGQYLRYDGHWSKAGHRVVASAISACIARDLR